jgi:hypothetical protein
LSLIKPNLVDCIIVNLPVAAPAERPVHTEHSDEPVITDKYLELFTLYAQRSSVPVLILRIKKN